MAASLETPKTLLFIVKTLQKYGFKLDILNQSVNEESHLTRLGYTGPLYRAIKANNVETMTYLLQNGIDPNANIDHAYGSDLHFAIRIGNIKTVQVLLEHGANVEECNTMLKETPLFEAINYEQWDIAYMLIRDYNANLHVRNSENESPLDEVTDKEIKDKLLFLSQQKGSIKEKTKSAKPSPGFALRLLSSNANAESSVQRSEQSEQVNTP
jgi:ankyrin repeat protein